MMEALGDRSNRIAVADTPILRKMLFEVEVSLLCRNTRLFYGIIQPNVFSLVDGACFFYESTVEERARVALLYFFSKRVLSALWHVNSASIYSGW